MRIFLSYARPEAAAARLVAERLRAAGHGVWMDDSLLAHQRYADRITAELDSAEAVLVLWSEAAVVSDWVRAEANRGREAGKLVQARLDNAALPMPFDQIQCLDIGAWQGDAAAPAWQLLIESLAAATGRSRAHPAAAAPRQAEQRQISSLAVRLADPALDGADAEDLLLFHERVLDCCARTIASHGGAIAQRSPEALLAHFGWPAADEEEAANAVRAALALAGALGRLELPAGLEARAATGIATGLVLVAAPAAARGEPGLVGPTPAEAGRLAGLAAPGSILVSPATARIVEGLFEMREVPRADGGSAHEVLALLGATSRSAARAARAGAMLFGRADERATLRARWALAQSGEGQVALLRGEAGIGKSALLNAVCEEARDAGGRVVRAQCAPGAATQPFHPLIPGLRAMAGLEAGEAAETGFHKVAALAADAFGTAAEAATALADLLGIPPPAAMGFPLLTPERRRAMLLETILALMELAAREQPVLFAVEDLHWADPSTLELLDRAVPKTIDRPWLIVGTARPEFRSTWADTADVTEIALGPLPEADALALATHVGERHGMPPLLLRQLVARAGGNPLFLEEITRACLDAGGAKAAGGTGQAIPETLADTLIARLDRLGQARQIASLAAAIGRSFGYELIAAVADRPAADLRQALRELARAHVLEAEGVPPTSRYTFRHALIRDAALGLLPRRQRQELHGRIAAALRAIDPRIAETNPAALAEHLGQSATPTDAIPLWAAAAARSASAAAYHEAAAQFRLALDLLRAHAPGEQSTGNELQLLVGLAVSLAAVLGFTHEEVDAALAEARRISEREGDDDHLLPVLRNLASFAIMRGDFAGSEELTARCEAIATRTNRIEHRIHTSETIGYNAFVAGRFEEARTRLEETLAMARSPEGMAAPRLTPQDPASQCLAWLQLVYHALGERDASLACTRDLAERVGGLDGPFHKAHAGLYISSGHFARGDHHTARTAAEETVRVCEDHGVPAFLPFAHLNRLHCDARLGNAQPALAATRAWISRCRDMGVLHFLSFSLCELALSELAAGETEAAQISIDAAVAQAERLGERFWLAPIHLARARILDACGAAPEAVAKALETAGEIARAQGARAYVEEAKAQLQAMQGAAG